MSNKIDYIVSDKSCLNYVDEIFTILSGQARTEIGIVSRPKLYIEKKLESKLFILALKGENLVGFCYIDYLPSSLTNSGLYVKPWFRRQGIGFKIKELTLQVSKELFPSKQIFGMTTNNIVLKINTKLGYYPVTIDSLPKSERFWNGCMGCYYFDVVRRTKYKMCLCNGMIYGTREENK